MRSKLFVPGSRPELFAKALAGDADALSFDLEDSVVENRKAQAREALRALLSSVVARSSTKVHIVRTNALATPHFVADLEAVVQPGLGYINLPKPERAEDVVAAAMAIEAAEFANGHARSGAPPVRLLLNIETPAALRRAAALALAHPRVAGLQLGLGDLFEPAGVDRRETGAIAQAMFAVRMAAAEAGVFAIDSAFANIADASGFEAEALMARRFGFIGKSCIHPSQVALANSAFLPTQAEIAHARRVLDAADKAQADGVGAWVVDGRMIDAPFVGRAREIVALAARAGIQ